MIGAAVIAVTVTGLVLWLWFAVHRWVLAQWLLVRLGRFLSGEAHHGRPVTDAGWFRPGRQALTPTGHATRWWHRPRWQRAAHRSGSLAGVLVTLWAFLAFPLVTSVAVGCLLLAAAVYGVRRAVRWYRPRDERGNWLVPAHLALHQIVGIPRAQLASSWIKVRTDEQGAVQWARFELPAHWPSDPKEFDQFTDRAARKLAIEAPEVRKVLQGRNPWIELVRGEPLPSLVRMGELLPELDTCRPDELLIGPGKGGLVKVSTSSDSPHFGASMGTGAGKSNLAAWLMLQILRRGGIVLVLDNKWMSHPWLIGLPNVAYARTPAELHAAMIWLGDELARRNKKAFESIDFAGKVHGDVGAELWIVAEELNLAMPLIKMLWSTMRLSDEPKTSPAVVSFGAVAFAGRFVRMHLLIIGQMLTAAATGSGKDSSLKENIGVKFMARYTAKGWRNVNDDIPMPPVPTVLGRVQVVTASGVREVQVPKVDLLQARELALAGTVTRCPPGMPGRQVAVTGGRELESGSEQGFVPVTEPSPVTPIPAQVTLKEAVELRLIHPRTSLGALRQARFRGELPAEVGLRGTAKLYDPAALAMWDQERRS
jgi:hypothetical protein